MCLIVERKEGDTLDFERVKDWHGANSDGWGFMFVRDGAVHVEKGMTFAALWRGIQRNSDKAYYLHLRMATHGDVQDSNTHPYEVLPGMWLMHNGIVDVPGMPFVSERSDTWHYIDSVLRPLLMSQPDPSSAIRAPWFRTMLEMHGGRGNRFVLMDAQGALTFNDDQWHTFPSGLRVSNTYALGGRKASLLGAVSGSVTAWKAGTGAASADKTWLSDYLREAKQQRLDNANEAYWRKVDDSAVDADTGEPRDIWESPLAGDPEPTDDERLMTGCTEDDALDFTYQSPERAAALIHYLIGDCYA